MSRILARLFGWSREPGPGDIAYDRAMNESADLLNRMREYSCSTDAARAVMADVWAQNHNVPFVTSVYQTVQEMKSGIEQKPEQGRAAE
jgi:hypothetical protein